MQYLAPDQVKGYTIQRKISEGGFGEVYLATETRPNFERNVVLKRILPKYGNDSRFIQRFESEARTIARLEYPYIVPLYDYWRNPDGAYLVMRWLQGGSVKDRLENGPLDIKTTARIMNHVCSALALSHKNGVIHRDVKPGNILLDEEGNAYLSDFGIAKDFLKFDSNTQPEDIIGSPKYISPEQARGEAVTPRTDVYSLGVTLYEMLAGEHPFPAANMYDLIYKHLNEPLPDLKTLDPMIQADINVVIQKATSKNPAHRYENALDFAQAFHAAAQLDSLTLAETVEQQLTIREQHTLCLLIKGLSNKEIASEMVVGHDTVRWHLRNAYKKLGVSRREQAIVVARTLNLVCNDETHVGDPGTSYIIDFEPENPYKGLESFTYADASNFYGRDKLVKKLLSRLEQDHPHSRFLAVLGPSGSGKSSLVKAGLVPARWAAESGEDSKWLVADMIPHEHPVDELDIALRRVATRHANGLTELLNYSERGLVKAAQLILPDNDDEILLVIDQFEEVFTQVESEEERIHFLNLITSAVNDSASRIRVVVTIRADYFDRPLYYPEFGEILRDRVETVLPLTAEELQQAIVEPARKVGVRFEEGLVAAIVSDIHYQPSALPLLQYALTEMFDQHEGRTITREVYEKIGGAAGAIASTAEELFQNQEAEGQEAIRQMFLRLVTLGEGAEDTRRRTNLDELLSISSDSFLMDDIIDTFASARMLSMDNDPTTRVPTVEVAHEAILREWERLRGWLNESRDDIKMQRQLAYEAQRWQEGQQDVSFLMVGNQLQQFEAWAEFTELALTQREQEFLYASLAQQERQQVEEESRLERELGLQRRAANRLRYLVIGLSTFLIVVFGLAVFAFGQRNEAQDQAATATIAQGEALQAADARATQERRALNEADIAATAVAESRSLLWANYAQNALENDDTVLAVSLALEANRFSNPPALAQQVMADAAHAPGANRRFEGHTDRAWNVAFAPDGKTAISGSADKTLILWDVQTGEAIRTFEGHSEGVLDVAFAPDGKTALSAGDTTLILWDVQTGEAIRTFRGHTGDVWSVAFAPDGRTALSGSLDTTLILWDVQTGQAIRTFRGHTNVAGFVAFAPDGRTALSGSLDTTLILWDVQTGQAIRTFEGHTGDVYEIAFSPDGATALSGGVDHNVILWDIQTGEAIRTFRGHTDRVLSVAFAPDGRTALSGSWDHTLILWDIATGQPVHIFEGHTDRVRSVAYSPDGHTVLSASIDNTLILWQIADSKVLRTFEDHTADVLSVAYAPDDRTALSGSLDNMLILRDVQTGDVIRTFEGHKQRVYSVDFAPDGQTALSGSQDNTLILWDIQTGEAIHTFEGHTDRVRSVDFAPDGRTALSGSQDNTLILWDIQTGEAIHTFEGHSDWVYGVAFAPDGQTALSASADHTLKLWDITTGQLVRSLEGHSAEVTSVAFASDGRTALSGSNDQTLRLWDTTTGQAIRVLFNHTDAVLSVAFASDGKTALSGSADNTLVLWDIETGQPIRTFHGHADSVLSVAFALDGNTALSGSADNTLILWRIDRLDHLIEWTYDNRLFRDLTCLERQQYQLEACDENGVYPTRTPFATWTPLPTNTPTPTVDLTRSTATLTITPTVMPSPTETVPTATPRPTFTPLPRESVQTGSVTLGRIAFGDLSTSVIEVWTLAGTAGQTLTIQIFGIHPAEVTVMSPSGEVIMSSTEAVIGPFELPESGDYAIGVTAATESSKSHYTITVR